MISAHGNLVRKNSNIHPTTFSIMSLRKWEFSNKPKVDPLHFQFDSAQYHTKYLKNDSKNCLMYKGPQTMPSPHDSKYIACA
jgi:hypothetical protein